MNLFNIIYCPISGVGLFDDPDDNEWLAYRLEIFKKYTLQSILNQSIKPDLLWLSFDGRRENPLINSLQGYLSNKIRVIITYEGLIYKDDKFIFRWRDTGNYQSTWAQAWRMLGRSIRKRKLRIFTRYLHRLFFKNRSLCERLRKSHMPWVNRDVIFTRVDSDDCLHKDWIKNMPVFNMLSGYSAICEKAYVYNGIQLAEWNPKTCPQTFAVRIRADYFNNYRDFYAFWHGYKSHEDANRIFMPLVHPNRFLMLIHGNQISSTWNHPFRGKIIEDKSILKGFGIDC